MALTYPGKPSRVQSFNVNCTVSETTYTLYTCPANCRAEVSMLMLVNVAGNLTASMEWNDASSGNHVHILGGKNMTAGEYVLFTGATLILESGDTLTITVTGSSPHADGLCTVTETFIPVG